MHIALLSTFYYPNLRGGAEHSLQYHAEELVRNGLKVSVFCLNEEGETGQYTHNGVECYTLPVPNLARCMDSKQRAPLGARAVWHLVDVFNPMAARMLERQLRVVKPDLVHTENLSGWSCSSWSAIRRCGLPHVQMLHDYQLTCPVATRFRNEQNCEATCLGCRPFAALRQRFSSKVKHVVANSNYTRNLHRELGFFSKAASFEVIYGAVPYPKAVLGGKRENGVLNIGYLGRLHPSKGLDLLIDSFQAAKREDAVLRIAGKGTDAYERELRLRAGVANIEFLGQQSASEFLASLDVLVVPSLWNEPMGRVVIEAAVHGIPVFASSRGGIPELVRDGRTGSLFEPSSKEQLVTLIKAAKIDFLRSLRPDCLALGREFAPPVVTARWLSLYEQLVGSGKAGGSVAVKPDTRMEGPLAAALQK